MRAVYLFLVGNVMSVVYLFLVGNMSWCVFLVHIDDISMRVRRLLLVFIECIPFLWTRRGFISVMRVVYLFLVGNMSRGVFLVEFIELFV